MKELRKLVSEGDAGEMAREATPRFVEAAGEAGLVTVGVGEVDSPLGPLLIGVTSRGFARIAYPGESRDDVLLELTEISPRVVESASATDAARRELDEYFAGRRRSFDLGIDWRLIGGFARRTLRATARIPFGDVTTYGALARRIGEPRAARAVGSALGSNPIPIVVPCHRVLRAGGMLGGYSGGLARKATLLRLEGFP
jgi:methylated-DNA-[protein]-cysteine S-methyltransferase